MKWILTALFGAWAFGLLAQIEESAPPANRQLRKASYHQAGSIVPRSPNVLKNTLTFNTLYVTVGEELVYCVDTVGLPGGFGSLSDLACFPLQGGGLAIDGHCFAYIPFPGVTVAQDSICLLRCAATNVCDTLVFPIVAKRPNLRFDYPLTVLEAYGLADFCAEIDALPGAVTFYDYQFCSPLQLGQITSDANCFSYEAGALSGFDTLCLAVCDEFTVCDTFVYPFQTLQDTLPLPFFDDFSQGGPHPSRQRWVDAQAFVNRSLGHRPPSIGVATLDGLDGGGSPYAQNGRGDVLSAIYLDLGSVPNAFLSFFVQPRGLGDKPEAQDSLILEFKTADDEWVAVDAYGGFPADFPNDTVPPFQFREYPIPADFLYKGFQFRFRNKTSGRGFIDLWHLDYVRVTQEDPSTLFPDVAFVAEPPAILQRYSAMPWRHFQGFEAGELRESYTLQLYNHFGVVQEIDGQTLRIVEQGSGTEVLNSTFLGENLPPVPLGNVPPSVFLNVTRLIPSADFGPYFTAMTSAFPDAEALRFEATYHYFQTGQNLPGQLLNDTIRRQTVFGNYFAYDDGSAESNLVAQGAGTQIAVGFVANVPDSLRGIQMHIPHVDGDVGNQLFNLKVWLSLDEDPIYEKNFARPLYVDEFVDSLQGFTTYALLDEGGNKSAVYLPAGPFYIGWQQVTATDSPIPVGFDKNTPEAAANIFYSVGGGGFEALPSNFEGALMLRPIVGNAPVFSTPSHNLPKPLPHIAAYPNPAQNWLYFEGETDLATWLVRVMDAQGRVVHQGQGAPRLYIGDWPDGLYLLQWLRADGQALPAQKIVKVGH